MNSEKINIDAFDLEAGSIVEMFEIDITRYGEGVFRFHPGTNGIHTDIIWQGNDYMSIPMEVHGMEVKADGTMARPTLSVANIDGYMSKIINSYDDLIGLKIRRKRTFIKYLDAVNFVGSENPYGIPDPDSHFLDEIYIINQKVAENPNVIEFELASPMELESVIVPARQVLSDYCSWIYRGPGCNYNDKPVATEKDVLFDSSEGGLNLPQTFDPEYENTWTQTGVYVSGDVVIAKTFNGSVPIHFICTPTGSSISGSDPRFDKINWKADQCSKSVYGCYLRFSGQSDLLGLPFGGFPGTHSFDMR